MSVGTSAALVAAGIGAAGSIGGALIGSSAASSAAKTQSAAAQAAESGVLNATQSAQGNLQQAQGTLNNLWAGEQNNLNPYLTAGAQGVGSLSQAVAPGGSLSQQFTAPTAQQAAATPGEQFMLQQGTQAVDRSAAAKGGLNTGATLQALTQYGQGLASTGYQQAYNNSLNAFQTNHNNTLGGYLALAGIGQNATGQLNQASQNYGGQTEANATQQGQFGVQGAQLAGNYAVGGANATAQGTLNAANSWNQGLAGVANAATGYAAQQNLSNIFGSANNGLPNPAIGNGGAPIPSGYGADGSAIYG